MRISQRLSRQDGSVLVTVLVGFGVVALVTSIVVNMIVMSKRSAVTAAVRAEFRLLLGQIRSIIEQENSCRTAIGGPSDANYSSTTGDATGALPYAQTFNAVTPFTIKLYMDGNGTVFLTSDPAAPIAQRTFGRMTVTDLKIIPRVPITTDNRTYSAYLAVTVQLPESVVGGNVLSNVTPTNTTNLPINIRVDATGRMISCSGLSMTGTATIPACKSDEALTTDGTGNFKCVRVLCSPWLEQSVTFPFLGTGPNTGSINCVWGGKPPTPPAGTPPPCNPAYPPPAASCP